MAPFDRFDKPFGPDTPVLRFNHGKVPDVRWVLWPIYAWRVVTPVPARRKLNLFQRAVLGLARARVTTLVDIADRLLIAPDLAGLIVLELQNMGALDHAGAPTARGTKLLDEVDEAPPDEVRVGHVLSDAFTGKLWPRFHTGDLPVADVELDEKGRPELLSGSAGDPWKDKTFSVLPGNRDTVVMARPKPIDVVKAARRHRRQRDFDEVDDDRDVPRVQRVTFIDEQPQPYLVALRVRSHHSGDWMVDDPFGHGEAVDLRARLEERLDSHNGLRTWLARVIGADAGTPTMAGLLIEAQFAVEERLTLAIRAHDALRELLVAMQRAFLEAETPDAPGDKWDDVLVKAQRAVERAMRTIQQRRNHVGPALFNKLAAFDKAFNRQLLDAIAKDIGLQSPLPETLSSVRRGKVEYAEQTGSSTLRPLVVLCLLAADADPAHPLRRAARTAPDLLDRLDALASARDRAAHDSASTRPDEVQDHVNTVYAVVKSLLLHS